MKDGRTLILKENDHYKDGTNAGRFDLPRGRLHPGEKFDEALHREVFEETGLSVRIGKPITVGEWRPEVRGEQWQIIAIFFHYDTDDSRITLSDDHDSFEWIRPEDYKKYPLIGNLRSVFEEYIGQFSKNKALEKDANTGIL